MLKFKNYYREIIEEYEEERAFLRNIIHSKSGENAEYDIVKEALYYAAFLDQEDLLESKYADKMKPFKYIHSVLVLDTFEEYEEFANNIDKIFKQLDEDEIFYYEEKPSFEALEEYYAIRPLYEFINEFPRGTDEELLDLSWYEQEQIIGSEFDEYEKWAFSVINNANNREFKEIFEEANGGGVHFVYSQDDKDGSYRECRFYSRRDLENFTQGLRYYKNYF